MVTALRALLLLLATPVLAAHGGAADTCDAPGCAPEAGGDEEAGLVQVKQAQARRVVANGTIDVKKRKVMQCGSGKCATGQSPPPDTNQCAVDPTTKPGCTNTCFNPSGGVECGKCYDVTVTSSGLSLCVYAVDGSSANQFEIDMPGWLTVCPRATYDDGCATDGPFDGAMAGPQDVTYSPRDC